jgi:hypothetical protein
MDSAQAKLLACRAAGFALLRQQANVVHAGGTHGVDGVFNRPELRARIRANVDRLARLVRQLLANQAAKLGDCNLVLS